MYWTLPKQIYFILFGAVPTLLPDGTFQVATQFASGSWLGKVKSNYMFYPKKDIKITITTKSTNPSRDHQVIPQNSSDITHASTYNFRSEMVARTPFVIDQIRSRKNLIKSKFSSLIDQVDLLKHELCSKNTIIKLIMENTKCNNEKFHDSNQMEEFVTRKTYKT